MYDDDNIIRMIVDLKNKMNRACHFCERIYSTATLLYVHNTLIMIRYYSLARDISEPTNCARRSHSNSTSCGVL